MRIVTVARGREVTGTAAAALRVEASAGVLAGLALARETRREHKPVDAPDRGSVKRAMRAIEARLVDALWTLARLPERNYFQSRHGIDYVQEAADRWGIAVDKGKWEQATPRPALPSSRAIDAMLEPLGWLALLPRERAKLLSMAAASKRGDMARNVSWNRVRQALPEMAGLTVRTLQRRYEDDLRAIMAMLADGEPS